MHFHVITIFPEICSAYTDASIVGRAQAKSAKADRPKKKALIKISYYNPRDYTKDKHRKTDDRPYGGGPGMVMTAQPILSAVEKAIGRKLKTQNSKLKLLIMSPRGKQFTRDMARKLSKQKDIVLIAGRYEGIDARVKKILKAEEVSIGGYTLTGGEIPVLAIIDAVSRNITGVLGKGESLEESRIASGEVYTRPDALVWKGKKYSVPGILKTGNHVEIERWKARRTR